MSLDFARPPRAVALDLLGATVVSRVGGAVVAVRLSEVEAYGAEDDPGSHAFRGPTKRNASMFEVGGTAYVYSIYGMHELLNIVTGVRGQASAVLLRAGTVVSGREVAQVRRGAVPADHRLACGPGNLAVCLGITRDLDGVLLGPHAALDVIPATSRLRAADVSAGARVGLRDDGRPDRYWVTGDLTVSKARRPAHTHPRDEKSG